MKKYLIERGWILIPVSMAVIFFGLCFLLILSDNKDFDDCNKKGGEMFRGKCMKSELFIK